MTKDQIADEIKQGMSIIGIEFGSTRIKAVLIDSKMAPAASGAFDWENSLVDGVWTYSLDQVREGLVSAFAALKRDVLERYGVRLTRIGALGISAMMHGYLAFDAAGNLLTPFRTWRNTMTAQASKELTALFNYPVPERWSAAHFYQAILNGEAHVNRVSSLNTLAGYVHYILSGRKVLGVGDASGMFPIDPATGLYDKTMLAKFDSLTREHGVVSPLASLLPEILPAGANAGTLTPDGAFFLDPTGELQPGATMAPPEGDAGTGMVATNSVAPRTGNISAGTSVFAMIVLEKGLSKAYPGVIDVVTTPDGKPTAMVHVNTCTSEYNKWISIFSEAASLLGAKFSSSELYDKLLGIAGTGDKDCGGIYTVNYVSGESVTNFAEGRPLTVRAQNSSFSLANFMRSHLYSAVATLRLGMDVLFGEEGVSLASIMGHGGFFKTEDVSQSIMAAALNTPVSTMSTAGEGGAWGMALLAAYTASTEGLTLPQWLNTKVFCDTQVQTTQPATEDVAGFNKWLEGYKGALKMERTAVESI